MLKIFSGKEVHGKVFIIGFLKNYQMSFLYYRLKVNFQPKELSPLPYDFHYLFYSALLKKIEIIDKNLAKAIHDGKKPRSILFSNFIYSKNAKKTLDGIYPKNGFHAYITSQYSEVMDSLIRAFLTTPLIIFDDKTMFIANNVVTEQLTIEESQNEFVFLSPIVIRSKNGKDLSPGSSYQFANAIKSGILRIAKKTIPEKVQEIEKSKVVVKGEFRKKVFTIKGFPISAYEPRANGAVLYLESQSAKQLALYTGIGDRVHLGFGMIAPKLVKS